jgi:beta-glucanase (GH16 family)
MRIAVAALVLLAAQPAFADEWKLVWSDEFDAAEIDRAKWGFDADCWGGGNAERQCYTKAKRNARIEDGTLVITARHERATGPALPLAQRAAASDPHAQATRAFTSAKLTTRGKAAWRYGRFEMRAILPQGQGTWPAFWMMPEKDAYGRWAASGEIDILEAVNLGVPCKACPGGREDTILGTLHFGKPSPHNVQKGTEIHFPEVLSGFHTYAVEWQNDRMIWQVDGRTYAEVAAKDWWSSGSKAAGAPFDQPFYLILNLAFGGGLPEDRGLRGVSAQDFPKRFAIDWVRVWQKADNPANPLPMQMGADQTGEVGK